LSHELGFPLVDEQAALALSALDSNNDGIVDFKEFQRWYFTGMKPYNNASRSMLFIGNKTRTIFEALKNQEVYEAIHYRDMKLSKQKLRFNFNDPEEVFTTELKWSIFGPNTT